MAIRKDYSFLKGFLFGAVVGFTVAIFTAPESGDEIRETLKSRGIELTRRAAELGERAQERAQELQKTASSAIESEKERVEEALSDTAQKVSDSGIAPPTQTENT